VSPLGTLSPQARLFVWQYVVKLFSSPSGLLSPLFVDRLPPPPKTFLACRVRLLEAAPGSRFSPYGSLLPPSAFDTNARRARRAPPLYR